MDDSLHEFLHVPENPTGAGLVLTHGAGANFRAPLLVAVAEAFCAAGVRVLRTDLAFRRNRAGGPPSPATGPADRAGLQAAVQAMRREVSGPVLLGGHSYGGRMATMLAAESPGLADGLLLLSYPLHPPGRPDKARTEHLPRLTTPCVFVHCTKDDFGSVEEMRSALALVPSCPALIVVEGAGHDLKRGKFDLGGLVEAIGCLPSSR